MVERIDFGLPVAGEKARKADEFVTKSQIVAGANVQITTTTNNDIVVASEYTDHATLSSLGWTESGHTGTAEKLAGFDINGLATYYDLTLEDMYGKITVPLSNAEPSDSITYETTETVAEGVYDVDVFVGIMERDVSLNEVNVALIQELELWDESISAYQRIGASHLLNYTGTAEGEYKLINRTLQGSAIITMREEPENRFKIRVSLPNHAGGGTGQITGGYIHYRRIE